MEGMEYFGGDSLISSLLLSLVDKLCLIDFFFFFFFFTEIHPINITMTETLKRELPVRLVFLSNNPHMFYITQP